MNIASIATLVANPGRTSYATSKGALLQRTRSIAADYAHAGIRCNALCPGLIETAMTQWRRGGSEQRNQVLAKIPQNEVGTVDDVASAVMFISDPQSRYFNGAALVMDGGFTAV